MNAFQLNFCRALNGLLLLTGGASLDDFLLIFLDNGQVSLFFNNFGGMQNAMTTSTYNDGESHTLQFTHQARVISFVIDGLEQPAITGFEAGKQLGRKG